MKARIWSRSETQTFFHRLRKEGYTIEKLDHGYIAINPENKVMLKAMPWNAQNYLIRHNFEEENSHEHATPSR